jgi:hypothetical protein
VPLGHELIEELLDAEAEAVGPLVRRRLTRLRTATEVPRFPGNDRADARNARGLARIGDGVDRLGRRGRQHDVDAAAVDEIFRERTRARRIRLRVAIEDLDGVRLPADREPFTERLANELEHVRVAFAETGERSGARADEADLDRFGGVGARPE